MPTSSPQVAVSFDAYIVNSEEEVGMLKWQACRNGNSQKGYWAVAGSGILTHTMINKRLAQAGYFSILDRYESLHLCD